MTTVFNGSESDQANGVAGQSAFPSFDHWDIRSEIAPLQTYATFVGRVRRALFPRQKHWGHASLRVAVNGLTTTPILTGQFSFDMTLNLLEQSLVLSTSRGDQWQRPLQGQSAEEFYRVALAALSSFGIEPEIDGTLFVGSEANFYDGETIQAYFRALVQIDAVLKQFKGELREETSPVQFWPHHFDLAMLWFSGRLVPGEDPSDEEYADEQMNFGFSPGDESIPTPYFYATAYPTPRGLVDVGLPAGASWHTEGWTGAVLPYDALVESGDARDILLEFLRTVQQAGANLMTEG